MIDTTIKMPSFSPLRIPTRGLTWVKKLKHAFSRRIWVIDKDYTLYLPWLNNTILIPKGFTFDGASVPRVFWPILDPVGILLIGSIFHDFGYIYGHLLDVEHKKIFDKQPRSFFDRQIRSINTYVNGKFFLNDTAWFILRLFGWIVWSGYRKKTTDVYKDFNFTSKDI